MLFTKDLQLYYLTHGTHHGDQLTVWHDTMPGVDCVPISIMVETLGSFKKKNQKISENHLPFLCSPLVTALDS